MPRATPGDIGGTSAPYVPATPPKPTGPKSEPPPHLPSGQPNYGPPPKPPVLPPTNTGYNLPTIGPFVPGFEPLKGLARLSYELNHAPGGAHVINSAEQDRFLLTLKPDLYGDDEYNRVLQVMQDGARNRLGLNKPKQPKNPFTNPAVPGGGAGPVAPQFDDTGNNPKRQIDLRIKKLNKELGNQPFVIDLNGNPVTNPDVGKGTTTTQTGTKVDTEAGQLPDSGPGPVDTPTLIGSGNYVWMGTATVPGVYGRGTANQSQYMSKDDLELILGRWTPQQVANFQNAMGLDVNGVVDKDTFSYWKAIVDAAARYTQAGQHVDINWIMGQLAKAQAVKASKGRGGGGGGGGGGGHIPKDQAKAFLNRYMKQYVGREATEAESNAFASAINGVSGGNDFDAEQFTIDWVKSRTPGEVGGFQAATDYYSAMMSVLGGGA